MSKVFKLNQNFPYELRTLNPLRSRNPKTVKYGTESISYLAPKIWSIIPDTIKNSESLESFKFKIRKWTPNCPCRLCKTFLQHVGFI